MEAWLGGCSAWLRLAAFRTVSAPLRDTVGLESGNGMGKLRKHGGKDMGRTARTW